MADKSQIRAEADRLKAAFASDGAQPVEVDILQPADLLLDLYGEDIRARAFVTQDPVRGECMLRPDFTVPVVLSHMESGRREGRYTYAGEVFRQQETGSRRPAEFVQAGYESFGGNVAEQDAEVFARISSAIADHRLRPVTGDIGLLAAAVNGLKTTEKRKGALRRHLWRPQRFRALLERFSKPSKRILPPADPFEGRGPEMGLRTSDEVRNRIETLAEDAAAAPISAAEIEALDALMKVRETMPNAVALIESLAVDLPAIEPALDALKVRVAALKSAGVDVLGLEFEATFGRTTLEYYDGFVFGFLQDRRPDVPPVASGGRYDALTKALGGDGAPPAVGGVIRPALLLESGA